ncbi:MAG: adenylate/guanylate cyclase domain-containing protein [Acidimicrobiia bacterium]
MRVERTFAFVDLSGFTRFTDAQGDEEAVLVLTAFRAAVREVASDHGVRVAKWLGDGAMFVATETAPVIETVLELQRRFDGAGVSLPLRAGIARGEAILFEGDDYIGSPVNLAARLCDEAGPFEVLAGADVGDSVPDDVVATPVGARVITGFGQPVELLSISPRSAFAAEALPSDAEALPPPV